jgi:hypothetical protein
MRTRGPCGRGNRGPWYGDQTLNACSRRAPRFTRARPAATRAYNRQGADALSISRVSICRPGRGFETVVVEYARPAAATRMLVAELGAGWPSMLGRRKRRGCSSRYEELIGRVCPAGGIDEDARRGTRSWRVEYARPVESTRMLVAGSRTRILVPRRDVENSQRRCRSENRRDLISELPLPAYISERAVGRTNPRARLARP